MIIHIDGTAQELLEFVKGMQFPITAGFCETAEETEEADEETQAEVEKEVERDFTEEEKDMYRRNGDWTDIMVEINRSDLDELRRQAALHETTTHEMANIVLAMWAQRSREER